MRASSPTDAGQGSAGLCRIPVKQGGNAPLRLRLTAHPPSGLRCPHRTARAEARLCSATVKPAPSRFLRRRRRSPPQPLAGEALGELPTGRLPCKGSWRRQPTEGCGALSCQYPSGPPQGSPAGVNARPTMQGKRAAELGRQAWRADDGRGVPSPCTGADASIGPPAGLAEGWRLCIATHSRPQCRAGDLASRLGFAASQGFRDDASIVPYGCGAGHCRSLQEAALKGKLTLLPLRAAFCAAALFAGRRFCQGVSGKVPALLMDRIRPKALSPVCRGVPLSRPVRGVCGRAASRSADKARSAPRLRPARPAAPRRWRAAGPGRP